jgi:hypothetical protein
MGYPAAVQSRAFLSRVAKRVPAVPGARLRELAGKVASAVVTHAATFAAWAAIDMGAFIANTAAGFIVTGVSILMLDLHVRG